MKIEELFTPLVLKCKENGRAMRIGTNHGVFAFYHIDLRTFLFSTLFDLCHIVSFEEVHLPEHPQLH